MLKFTIFIKALLINSFILFLSSPTSISQELPVHQNKKKENKEVIAWISFEEAVAKSKKEPRKILIDVYTSWCGWCKHMDAITYEHPEIIKYMNQKYYAVKLDAEQKTPVRFKDKEFIYKPEFKTHELALSLLNNKMGYPTTIFMNESFAILTPVSGFIDAKSMEPLLKYYGGNSHTSKTWEEYQKTFVGVITSKKPAKTKISH